jgi:heme exporter protein A
MMRLSGEGLAVERGGRIVFSGVNLALTAGELLVLTGRNGAGKTSLLKLIAGILKPSSGALSLAGGHGDLSIGQQTHLVAHNDALKPALTVEENLQFWTGFLGGEAVEAGLQAFGLSELAGVPAGVLSAGQQRRLSLARLIAVHRPIWLLDEPTVGLDDPSLDQLALQMREHLKAQGLIVAATHGALPVQATSKIDLGSLL